MNLKVFRIDVGEIIHVAAYDEAGALGLVVEHLVRGDPGGWLATLIEFEPVNVEPMPGDYEICIGHPNKLEAEANALCDTLPSPCFLCTSEY